MSFSTAATQADRWASFSAWAKEQGVGRMERIDKEMVRAYGRELADQVKAGDLAPCDRAKLRLGRQLGHVPGHQGGLGERLPTKDCGIAQRSAVREDAPGALDRAACARAIEAVRVEVGDRAAAVVELARELGLRSKEASSSMLGRP